MNMVDVVNKLPSCRIARARTYVIFPTKVMSALGIVRGGMMAVNNIIDGMNDVNDHDDDREGEEGRMMEMIGPKGPIFDKGENHGDHGTQVSDSIVCVCVCV